MSDVEEQMKNVDALTNDPTRQTVKQKRDRVVEELQSQVAVLTAKIETVHLDFEAAERVVELRRKAGS